MKKSLADLLIVGILITALFIFMRLGTSLLRQDPTPILDEAYHSFTAGEKASNMAERQKEFNKALELYASLEKEYHPSMGNGRLYYNIANSYYQLEEYPWAILYDYKALALNPRNERALSNLNASRKKLELPPIPPPSPFHALFYYQTQLSLAERIQLFTAAVALMFISFSLFIWTEKWMWRVIGMLITAIVLLMMMNLGYSYYIAPIQGVMVKSSLLYRDAGFQYAPVNDSPTPSGENVHVLETLQNGQWLKVQTPSGTVGFIPAESLRLY